MATKNPQGLSPKAKEVLQRNAELRQKDNKFIKIEPGQKKILKFNPEKIEQVEAGFNGKKRMRFRYTVIEEGSSTDQEKYLEVGKRTSEDTEIWRRHRYTISCNICLRDQINYFIFS